MCHQGVGVVHAVKGTSLNKETALNIVLEDVGLKKLVLVDQLEREFFHLGHLFILTEVVGGIVRRVRGNHGFVVALTM